MHRLDNSTLGGSQNLDVTLDTAGNITNKTGVGTYTYHATKIHAVTSIAVTGGGTMTFGYDSNGNMTNRNGTTLAWLTNNLPKTITKDANNSSTFQYGPHRQRWQQVYKTAGTIYTHTYVGRLMEKVVTGGTTDFRHFVNVNGQSIAVVSRKSTGTNAATYRLDDHLGSTEHLTDNVGANVVMESFGAYGQRRGSNWVGAPTPAELTTINDKTRKGFTEHEMLDNTDLVHMNGRVFDPIIGRFVSGDPVDGCGDNTQRWNRYAYVKNSPMSRIDPSGFDDLPVFTSTWWTRDLGYMYAGNRGMVEAFAFDFVIENYVNQMISLAEGFSDKIDKAVKYDACVNNYLTTRQARNDSIADVFEAEVTGALMNGRSGAISGAVLQTINELSGDAAEVQSLTSMASYLFNLETGATARLGSTIVAGLSPYVSDTVGSTDDAVGRTVGAYTDWLFGGLYDLSRTYGAANASVESGLMGDAWKIAIGRAAGEWARNFMYAENGSICDGQCTAEVYGQ